MTDKQRERYRRIRRDHPFMPAKHALSWAKTPDASERWDEALTGGEGRYEREVEGFTIRLRVEEESIYPVPNRHGDTDYGRYVDEVSNYHDYGSTMSWGGNWPPPREDAPLGIPYTAIRYSGPGWVQGEGSGYFIPDGIEDEYESFRRRGQSKSVAWELTLRWVEDQLEMLFSSPLTTCDVIVSAEREGVKLASTCMGTDVSGDDEGREYIFQMVEDHDMIGEVLTEARERIAALTEATP
jgi:hypothetical protein